MTGFCFQNMVHDSCILRGLALDTGNQQNVVRDSYTRVDREREHLRATEICKLRYSWRSSTASSDRKSYKSDLNSVQIGNLDSH